MASERELLAQIHALSAEPTDDELGLGPAWQLDQIRLALGVDLTELRTAWSDQGSKGHGVRVEGAIRRLLGEAKSNVE